MHIFLNLKHFTESAIIYAYERTDLRLRKCLKSACCVLLDFESITACPTSNTWLIMRGSQWRWGIVLKRWQKFQPQTCCPLSGWWSAHRAQSMNLQICLTLGSVKRGHGPMWETPGSVDLNNYCVLFISQWMPRVCPCSTFSHKYAVNIAIKFFTQMYQHILLVSYNEKWNSHPILHLTYSQSVPKDRKEKHWWRWRPMAMNAGLWQLCTPAIT